MYLSLASVSKLLATVGVGSKDASTLLDGLTADQPERELVRELNRRVGLLLAVRAEVLRRALLAFPDLTPKEWLHAQHSPHVFGDEDVFARAFAVAVAATGEFSDVALRDLLKEAKFPLLALDEVKRTEGVLPVFSSSNPKNTEKRDVLTPIAKCLGDFRINVLYAGTGLGVANIFETLKVPVLQPAGGPYVLGITTWLDSKAVVDTVKRLGYAGEVDHELAERFVGRPCFATTLAKALIMGEEPESVCDRHGSGQEGAPCDVGHEYV